MGVNNVLDKDPPFVSASRIVPATLGVGFGVKAQSEAPAGLSGVLLEVLHPPMGPEGQTRQSFFTSMSGQSPSITFYQFDHPYELVTGQWTIRAYSGEVALLSVTFEVVDPRSVPELAVACNFIDLLS